ncbi:MAG: phosphoserine transaminase [Rhizobiales bacterium]|nr:phosphoserine transaminase [Hyphomicrobiales bacterium]
MTLPIRPAMRPADPRFSSGPCVKRPGWDAARIFSQDPLTTSLGRSHRAKAPKARIVEAIERTRALLGLPDGYRLAIVPASDTGAFEMAMWTMLGARGVDALAWESFGAGWVSDIRKELKLADVRVLEAPYGDLPDLRAVDFDRDVVFTWNGTTSGVRVPDGNWIAGDRKGLTFCDATSAAFAQVIDWPRIDVATFSWQKALGGEGQHGMLVLSPRAVERLESYTPAWPVPKIFRLTKGGKLMDDVFEGATINTPSMLCVEDYLDALTWGQEIGGLAALTGRADRNAGEVAAWVERTPWVGHLARVPATRSNTSVCLEVVDPEVTRVDAKARAAFAKDLAALLEREGVALDIGAYRDAPPGLRIWCGCTVERSDVAALLPWLDWAHAVCRARLAGS